MKYLSTCLFIALLQSSLFGQIGDPFPYLEGENLENKLINLPEDVKGKHSLIGMAYSRKAEEDLKSWFEPAYNQFIRKPDKNDIFQISYDVNVYFIPMFTGAKRPAYEATMAKVKKDIDDRLEPYVLFYKGKLKEYEEALEFEGKEVPYFFVLDEDGVIVHATSGTYTDKKMQVIIDLLPF